MKKSLVVAAVAFSLAFMSPMALADDQPPSGARPLSGILASLEDTDVGVITKAEFDDGYWEIKAVKNGQRTKLYVHPDTGQIDRRKSENNDDDVPPSDALRLSEIVKGVEQRGVGVITEVEFDDSRWEIKVRDNGKRVDLRVDPRTGEQREKRRR